MFIILHSWHFGYCGHWSGSSAPQRHLAFNCQSGRQRYCTVNYHNFYDNRITCISYSRCRAGRLSVQCYRPFVRLDGRFCAAGNFVCFMLGSNAGLKGGQHLYWASENQGCLDIKLFLCLINNIWWWIAIFKGFLDYVLLSVLYSFFIKLWNTYLQLKFCSILHFFTIRKRLRFNYIVMFIYPVILSLSLANILVFC